MIKHFRELGIFSLFLALFLLAGCATKRYEPPTAALIVFKTPTLRYADQGFVYRAKEGVKVQVYASGKPVFELEAGKRVCVDGRCMDEERFYKEFMGTEYPRGTLSAIFSRRPVFGGENLECEAGRCTQRIRAPGRYDIIYAFDSRSAKFKDRLNRIYIKMTETP